MKQTTLTLGDHHNNRQNINIKQVDYTTTKQDETETVTLQIVSECSKSFLVNLLITFNEDEGKEENRTRLFRLMPSNRACTHNCDCASVAVIAGHTTLKHKKAKNENE